MSQFRPLTGSLVLDLFVAVILGWTLWTYVVYRRLSHIPGPTSWALSVYPLFRLHQQGDLYHGCEKLTEKYGPLVRIAPYTLLTSDADVVRRMNAPRSPYTRGDWYLAMRMTPGVDNVLSTLSDKDHDARRKKMAAAYSELCDLIGTKYAMNSGMTSGAPLDLGQKVQFLTSDIMSKLAFDAKFHDLRDDRDNFGYLHEIETMFPKMFAICCFPRVLDFVTKIGLLKMFAPTADAKLGIGKIVAIAKQEISQRFNTNKEVVVDKKDMLGSFLRHGMTYDEVEAESVLQLAAGSDTTSTTIRCTMFGIMSSPRAYNKLVAEIDGAVKSGKIPSSLDQVLSDSVARELPYLQACIKEGQRWHPALAGMLPKKTPPQGDTIAGYFVPGGISIAWSAKAINRNPALFGPDPEAFRPDRWIHTSAGGHESSKEKITMMERNNDLGFGHGKYSCLGKSVALMQLNKIYVELFRRFEFTPMVPMGGWEEEICVGVFFLKGFRVTARKRDIMV